MSRIASTMLVVLLLVAAPAQAADTPTTIPEPKWPTSGRLFIASTVNGAISGVSQIAFMTGATPQAVRYHGVTQNLDATDVQEEVVIGGHSYQRVNTEPRWKVRAYNPPEDFEPRADLLALFAPREHASIVRLGDVLLDGIPTTHYQLHVAHDRLPGDLRAVKLDLFIGQADGYLYQEQLLYRAIRDASGQEKDFGIVLRLRDIGAELIIGAPPATLVDS